MAINFSELSDLADKQFSSYNKALAILSKAPKNLRVAMLHIMDIHIPTFLINDHKKEYVDITDIDCSSIIVFGQSKTTFTLIVSFPVQEQNNYWSLAIPVIAKYDETVSDKLKFMSTAGSANTSDIGNWHSTADFAMHLSYYLKECLEFNPIIGGAIVPPIIID